MNSYELSRQWFDWCFENTSKISPSHTALYFFIIEHNNRLGWKEEFGLPRQMAMEAIGIRNQRTFTKIFNDLENWNFIKVKQRSKNQYSANIIALSKNTKATTKALDKARVKHVIKHSIGIAPIDKQLNNKTIKQENGKISLAFDLIKLEKPDALNVFEMKSKKQVQDWQKLIKSFNDKMELELVQNKIEFESEQLFPRFKGFTNSWISNEQKYDKTPEKDSYESGKLKRF